MRQKKHKLFVEEEELLPDAVLRIQSHARDYKLVWAINNGTILQFIKHEGIISQLSNAQHSRYMNDNDLVIADLIKNKSDANYFVPEEKHVDYFLVLQEVEEEEVQNLIKVLNTIKEILLVNRIDLSNFKSQVNFYF